VRRADDLRNAVERGRGGDNSLPDDGMASHELPLAGIERRRLVQDCVRNRELAHVVQLRRLPYELEVLAREPEPTAKRHCQLGDV
jgi:hypothetical protein